jgi:hypothetical protein
MIRHIAARMALDCLDIASVIVSFIDLHVLLPVLLSGSRLRDAVRRILGPLPDQRPEALCIQLAADAVGYGHGVQK